MPEPIKKFSISLLTAIFVSVVVLGSVSFVQPARAQMIVHDTAWDIKEVKLTFEQILRTAVLNASLQAVSYFARKVAYDSAVWLASGGKGQNPFAHTSSFGSYIKNTADTAVGAGIEALGTPFGLNLCKIPDARLDLLIRLSIPNLYGLNVDGKGGPPEPNCSFSDFKKNWTMKNFNSMYGADNIADRFNMDFQADQSDLGIYIGATTKIDNLRIQEVYNKDKQRTEDQGAMGFTDLISGNIKTPGAVMMQEIKSGAPSEGKKVSDAKIDAAFSAGVYQILPSTLSMFLNTLASQMLTNYQTKGMFPFGIGYDEGGGGGGSAAADYTAQGGAAGGFSGRRLAEEMFKEYKIADVKSIDNYTILARFGACPDLQNSPAVDNCVADQDLIIALQGSTYGTPLTIGEALSQKVLDGTKKLIPPSRKAENEDRNCFKSAYCYRNVQMLRKARVFPLGFEAATYLSDPDKPWNLEQVVNGFNDCDERKDANGKVIGVNYDPVGHPFCHLIDPNWVLKLPDTKCNAMAVSSVLMTEDVPNRLEECVDFSSCVQYDGNKCVAYGYCTREKNVWKFSTNNCEAQYNSCRTFSNVTTGAQVNYLYRTLDTGSCDSSSVGCKGYSINQVDDLWQNIAPVAVVDGGKYISANANSGIFFNKTLSTSCPADSAGCTAFNFAENPGGVGDLNLRKAPDYLKCYDKTPLTASLDWPQTESDLSLLRPKADCAKYAKPCIPDEVSCNWYTPVNSKGTALTSEKIPGKYTPGTDECNKVCVGYDAYREMSSNYSVGQDLTYIIPKSGRECSASEEGCSSFTNLSTTAGGLEQVEYYSFLRSCILPDPAKQKTFYTYAGSMINGYELIVYDLVEDKTGGPQYFYKTAAELTANKSQCDEAQYRLGASPDCRQFNDANGQIYYRLLSQTVAVSDQCTPYRLNETALTTMAGVNANDCVSASAGINGRWDDKNNVCEVCLQNGEFRPADGHCYYSGLPSGVKLSSGESTTCSAGVNTCRKYKGNRANDVEVALFADFDEADKDLTEWSVAAANQGNAVLSLESTHLGQHSLMFNVIQDAGEVRRRNLGIDNVGLNPGESYEISFWAKGDVGQVTVRLDNGTPAVPTELGNVSVTDVWKNYKIGSGKVLAGTATSTILNFKAAKVGHLFLDNIRLVRMNDVQYLVKNSLKVDPSCDSNLEDNLPGEALGCTEYKTNKNVSKYLTNFSYLCREESIGCVALLDTRNTLDTDKSKIFGLWVPSANMAAVKTFLGLLGENAKDPCTIAVGESGCYITDSNLFVDKAPSAVRTAGGVFVTSTIYIPADTSTTTPVYLVASESEPFNCHPSSVGCMEVGAQVPSVNGWQYVSTTIKNDPAAYVSNGQEGNTGTLCQSESVGCTYFKSSQGDAYFKDPIWTNQQVCTYSEEITIGGSKFKGWIWKGVGRCVNSNPVKFCTTNTDCPGSTCNTAGDPVPCYSDYLQGGTTFGLWSYGNKEKYKNYVGECLAKDDGCKEFVDHDDANRAYYFIAKEKFNQGDCEDGVSRKYGCILLDDTGQPNKFWNSAKTYEASKQKGYEKVKPEVGSPVATNDANILVKVSRDRECAEWLYSNQIHPTFTDTGEKNNSYSLGVCNKAQSGVGFITQCANDVTSKRLKGQFLDAMTYVRRPTSWSANDYSGFSLFNSYQLIDITPVPDPVDNTKYVLAYQSPNPCANQGAVQTRCGLDNDHDGSMDGWCINSNCTYPADGISDKNSINFSGNKLESLICRGYPEVDSPFPAEIVTQRNDLGNPESVRAGFANANVCELKDANGRTPDCECSYKKVTYGPGGEIKKYYGYTNTPPEEVDNPYGSGDKYRKSKEAGQMGWRGYCVQRDIRGYVNGNAEQHPCMLWYPVDIPLGVKDINAYNQSASFPDVAGDRYICVKNDPVQQTLAPENVVLYDDEGATDFNIGLDDGFKVAYSLPNSLLKNDCVAGGSRVGCYTFSKMPRNAWVAGSWLWHTSLGSSGGVHKMAADGGKLVETYIPLSKAAVFGEHLNMNVQPPVVGNLAGVSQLFPGNFDINEIKQIDVYVGEDSVHNYPARLFVFSQKAIEEDGCHNVSDGQQISFSATGVGASFQNYCVAMTPVDGVPSSFTKDFVTPGDKYYYWQWQEDGLASNYVQHLYDNVSTPPGVPLAGNVIVGSNNQTLGLRIVFQKNNNKRELIGLVIAKNTPPGANSHIHFFAVVHLNNGICQQLAQVSSVEEDGGNTAIFSKPVTWRLRKDQVMLRGGEGAGKDRPVKEMSYSYYSPLGIDAYSVSLRRMKNTSHDPYGLSSINLSIADKSVPVFVDPFDPYNIFTPDKYNTYYTADTIYKGGVPITNFSNKTAAISYMNFNDLTNCTSDVNWMATTTIGGRREENLVNPVKASPFDSGACSMMERMFAKVFSVWNWDSNLNGGMYVQSAPSSPIDVASPNVASVNNYRPYRYYVPKIASVDMWSCAKPEDSKAGCGLAKLNKFTVERTDNASVFVVGNNGVSIKFFAWADAAQMPLRRFMVDFGNGAAPYNSSSDSQSNFKSYCGDTTKHCSGDENISCVTNTDCTEINNGWSCVENGNDLSGIKAAFGSTEDTGCKKEYYQVYGQYSCDVSELFNAAAGRPVWDENSNKKYNPGVAGSGNFAVMRATPNAAKAWEMLLTEEAKKKGLTEGSIVCAYRPKVQVLDNWGWCSGSCYKADGGLANAGDVKVEGSGCYNDTLMHLCTDVDNAPHWVEFDGNVIVISATQE